MSEADKLWAKGKAKEIVDKAIDAYCKDGSRALMHYLTEEIENALVALSKEAYIKGMYGHMQQLLDEQKEQQKSNT